MESLTLFLWHSADVSQKVNYQAAKLWDWKAKAIKSNRWLMICFKSGVNFPRESQILLGKLRLVWVDLWIYSCRNVKICRNESYFVFTLSKSVSAKIGLWLVCGVSTCKASHKIQLFHYTHSLIMNLHLCKSPSEKQMMYITIIFRSDHIFS